MATKVTDVQARIGASVGGFESGMKSAAAAAKVFERELAKVEAAQRQMAQAEAAAYREERTRLGQQEAAQRRLAGAEAAAYREEATRAQARVEAQQKVGRAFLATGAVIALGIGMATKAAMDWQSAFAGLEKTLPAGTSQGALGVLDRQIRDLSKTIPVSAEELAGLAASASQLGVGQQYLVQFTRVAADLGATTTMSAEDAVTGLAKLGNVMEPGKFAADIGRAGSALLALGNEGASTEAEILDMAQRIAGAGKTVGMTEPQVLGLANALTSVGLDAEAGGTAVSRVMIDMAKAVDTGGESLDNFARVSGMTSAQFAGMFKADAAGALTAFIGGLAQLKARGQDVFGTLDAMHLSEVRVRDTLLRASEASGLLTQSLKTGEQAWQDANALSEAAGKRYETAASKILIARNSLQDTAITIGGQFLPVVAAAGEKTAALIQVFDGLPAPAKEALGVLGGLGGAALILGGTALTLVPKIHQFVATLEEMGPAGTRAASAARSVGSVLAGPWGLALAAGTIALGAWVEKQAEAKQHVAELTDAVKADGNAIGENTRKLIANQLAQDGVLKATRDLGLSQADVLEATLGNAAAQAKLSGELDKASTAVKAQGTAIYGAGGTIDPTIAKILLLKNAIGSQNGPLKEAITNAKDEASALSGVGASSGPAASGLGGVAKQAIDTKQQAKAAKDALDDLTNALKGLADQELGMEAAQDTVLRDLKSVEDAAKAKTTGKGKVSSDDRAKASDAGKLAKAEAIASGKTRAEAIIAGKNAREAVLAAARKASTGTTTGVDPLEVRAGMRQLVQDELDIIATMAKQGASADELKAKSVQLAKQVYDEGRKIGLTKDQAQHYADVLKDVPDVVNTAITTSGLDHAIAQVKTLGDNLQIVAGKGAIPITIGGDTRPYSTPPSSKRTPVPYSTPPAAGRTPVRAPVSRAAARHFAAGGVEDHQAQYGLRRIWGEPETGGEAYIPLAAGKRARSTALLSDVAHRFGMNVTRGQGPAAHVVRVPVQQTHTETHPVNVTGPITVVANSPAKFTDWAATQHGFGSAKVG